MENNSPKMKGIGVGPQFRSPISLMIPAPAREIFAKPLLKIKRERGLLRKCSKANRVYPTSVVCVPRTY